MAVLLLLVMLYIVDLPDVDCSNSYNNVCHSVVIPLLHSIGEILLYSNNKSTSLRALMSKSWKSYVMIYNHSAIFSTWLTRPEYINVVILLTWQRSWVRFCPWYWFLVVEQVHHDSIRVIGWTSIHLELSSRNQRALPVQYTLSSWTRNTCSRPSHDSFRSL